MPSELTFPVLTAEQIQSMGLGPFIDHTLLKPEAEPKHIEALCREALKHKFAGVCVNSSFVPFASSLLSGSNVMVISVVGFPLGANDPKAVAFEAQRASEHGAQEIDMVLPVGRLKSKDYSSVLISIKEVVASARGPVKVILETGLLTDEEKKIACSIALEAGALFVKTCTGFGPGAATEADVRLMKSVVGEKLGVKASGGIRSFESAQALLLAGAHRLGTSSGVALVQNQKIQGGY